MNDTIIPLSNGDFYVKGQDPIYDNLAKTKSLKGKIVYNEKFRQLFYVWNLSGKWTDCYICSRLEDYVSTSHYKHYYFYSHELEEVTDSNLLYMIQSYKNSYKTLNQLTDILIANYVQEQP